MAAYALDGCNDTFSVHMSHQESARRAHRPLRIAAPMASALCLPAVCAWLLSGCGGHESAPVASVSCFGRGSPQVGMVHYRSLTPLRASVLRVLPQRVARLYEEGTTGTGSLIGNDDPAPPTVLASALRPDGYEMRWIAPNGDQVVASALSFPSAHDAQRFIDLAASPRCRIHGARSFASRPPLARNLAFVNADGATEADVYLLRGKRVYRVGDVHPSAQGGISGLGRVFFTIDTLACLLPGAHCRQTSPSVPV